MKKNILKALALSVILAFILTSCEALEDCKTCSLVTYTDGVETSRTPGVLYCGDKLAAKENEEPTTIGNVTTQWECD